MLNKIKFSYEVAEKQECLFTPYHTLYKCKIKYMGLSYTFKYQCNASHCKPNLNDCLDSLFLDASSYEDSKDIIDFCNEFGYTDSTGTKAYKACKKTYNAIHRLFTDEEIEKLYDEIEM